MLQTAYAPPTYRVFRVELEDLRPAHKEATLTNVPRNRWVDGTTLYRRCSLTFSSLSSCVMFGSGGDELGRLGAEDELDDDDDDDEEEGSLALGSFFCFFGSSLSSISSFE